MRCDFLSALVILGGLGLCLATATSANAGELYLVDDLDMSMHQKTAGDENFRLLEVNTASDWDDGGTEQVASGERNRIWYGGEMLWWTGGSLLLGIAGNVIVATGTEAGVYIAGLGSLGVAFSGMYVHAKYGYWGRAFGSLGLRVGLPVAALFLGIVATGADGVDSLATGIIGAFLGVLAGHTLDYMMAYRDAPGVTNEPPMTDETEFEIRISPYFNLTEEQQSAGLLVAF